jgi:hypothetical protein
MVKLTIPAYKKKIFSIDLPSDGFSSSLHKCHIFYIDVKWLNTNQIKLDANVRKPEETKATKAMESTISDPTKQARFWAYNGGLIIVTKKVKINKSKGAIEIDLPKEYGLMNGGHTQFSIKRSLKAAAPTNTLVRVEVVEGEFTDEELADIAEARNTSKNLKDMSLAWKKKKFVRLQSKMLKEYSDKIAWTTGELLPSQKAMDADKFIFLLMMLNVIHNPIGKPPKATSTAGPFDRWLDNIEQLQFLDEIANDIIKLHDLILSTFDTNPSTKGLLNQKLGEQFVFKKKNLKDTPFDENTVSRSMPEGILLPLLSAFRAIIEVDETKKRVRWTADPVLTWEKAKGQLMENVNDELNNVKKILEIRDGTNFWKLCANVVAANKVMDPKTGKPGVWKSYK